MILAMSIRCFNGDKTSEYFEWLTYGIFFLFFFAMIVQQAQ